MLVYRTARELVDPHRELARLHEAPAATHDDITEFLIRLGQIESALADWAFPEFDGENWTTQTLRRASVSAGHAFRASLTCRYDEVRGWLGRARRDTADLAGSFLPETVTLSVPEGYAYYGLYPETYYEAALRFFAKERPDRVVVLGIRSIGTSLSAVIGAALEEFGCELESWTVRPHGHPFNRVVRLTPELEQRIAALSGAHFAIVDEGPGLSGSSFASVAATLSALGVPDHRIALFPSWTPNPEAFRSDHARLRWTRHAKYAVGFEESRPPAGLSDISGGFWREKLTNGSAWPAVQPQHERRKYLGPDFISRFAGLGSFGRAKLARAAELAQAGFSPRPLGLANGFLKLELVSGTPVSAASSELLDTLARYLCFLRAQPAGVRGVSFDDLTQMIEVNTAGAISAQSLEHFRRMVSDAVPIAIDGRMLPHEWIRTAFGYVKTDSLDHHDDHFFPGNQDIAWDVAGASVEFALDPAETATLVERCEDPGLAARLPFYRIAYTAFRLGYATLASEAISGTPDAARFAALAARYRGQLTEALPGRSFAAPSGPTR